jgi:ATP-dependent helicase/nuclease subunit A
MIKDLRTCLVRAPAGSGKTEKLARRFIALLKLGVPPERILTITFTEKAAAEMKERIFSILKEEDRALWRNLKEAVWKLRVQTIDSFCLSLIRTFALNLHLRPDLMVAPDSEVLFLSSCYETLMRIAEKRNSPDYKLLLDLIADGSFRGWQKLFRLFKDLFGQRVFLLKSPFMVNQEPLAGPMAEDLFAVKRALRNSQTGEKEVWFPLWRKFYAGYFARVFSIFKDAFLSDYSAKKKEKGLLDFPDLEFFVYQLLHTHPEWQNILYLFDQNTDHILVDELQDTSLLQWQILDKLTEEWRSGIGAKQERKVEPTLFLVGDEKQSIYFFRNATSEIFARVRDRLHSFLGERFVEETITDNFRSLKAIVDFTNFLFRRVFTGGEGKPPYLTPYSEFVVRRDNPAIGKVEIILEWGEGKVAERRRKEAEIIAQRIKTLLGSEVVFDKGEKKIPLSFEHIAILLRQRTHLAIYEKALRDYDIPYLVVKGIGFYSTPEVRLLLSLINFLLDPYDDFSLYCILKSLFPLTEKEIFLLRSEGESLFSRIKKKNRTLFEELASIRGRMREFPLPVALEEILTEKGGFRIFFSEQEYYNIKKFIRICENLWNEGKSVWEIRDYFSRAMANTDEPKADIAWEEMKAVRIMTVHAAKGLEFPVVIFAGLDESLNLSDRSDFIFEDKGEKGEVIYLPERELKKLCPAFAERKEKMVEEEKRIFYVACTRARDYLILTGIVPQKISLSRLQWVLDAFSIRYEEGRISSPVQLPGLEFLTATDLQRLKEMKGIEKPVPEKREIDVADLRLDKGKWVEGLENERVIKPVTKETAEDLRRHGEGAIILGEVIHKILERIARGELVYEDSALTRESEVLCELSGLTGEEKESVVKEVLRQMALLRRPGLKEIILPCEGGYAELPFLLVADDVIYQGRIDRVIVQNEKVSVYDYKTYRVEREEIPQLLDFYYRTQMSIYLQAVSSLFPGKRVEGYLVFTALGEIFPVREDA